MLAKISTAKHRNVNPALRTHYRLSGSEQQIIFRSGLLGKERNSDNPHGVIGLHYLRKRMM